MINFDKIGDFNPQLLRELKSRLGWRNGLISIGISVVTQLLLLLAYYAKLPQDELLTFSAMSYCLKAIDGNRKCTLDSLGTVLIDWPQWWSEVSHVLSWFIVYGLVVGGGYLLSSSFAQEEKRGTLDFIRLTPQRASDIFIGKLLGVPFLVYLGVALALPLQFYGAKQANISIVHMLSWDLFMAVVAVMLFMGAMLATMWFKAQSILLTAAAAAVTYPVIQLSLHWGQLGRSYSYSSYSGLSWYGVLNENRLRFYIIFTVLTTVGIYWLYQALKRRYLQPKSIVLSKAQSYFWSLLFNLFLLGFHFTMESSTQVRFTVPFHGRNTFGDVILAIFGFAWLILLVPMLLPSRQALAEWARHGNLRTGQMLRSWLWQDKSPGTLAVAVNVAIAAGVWLIPCMFVASYRELLKILLGMLMTITLTTIYSSIAHWVLFWPIANRQGWTIGIIAGLIFGPSIAALNIPGVRDVLYLFTPFLWNSVGSASISFVILVLVLQLAALAWLTLQLRKSLTKVGRSESFQYLQPSNG
jgi:hypothetical protein